MGQYHYLVNLTKREYVMPHEIGNGLKLTEQVGWPYSSSTVLVMLLAASNGRGGEILDQLLPWSGLGRVLGGRSDCFYWRLCRGN